MIKIIIIIAAVYLCVENSVLLGVSSGYAIGADLCGAGYSNQGIFPKFSPYENPARIHQYINWFLIFFIIGKLLNKEILSQFLSFPSILLAFVGFVQVYNLKNSYVTNEDKYFDVMRVTFQTDYVHIWLAFALLIYQVIIAFQSYFEWKRNKSKVE